ncbi:hypothetical protein ACFP81_13700 [Deinococcus lacus]|uniref:Uncharacterized protein n=1 Tax=Deinococcus lacus TaxID=392561 RepID=A0ABW1YIC5_9DEIO
MTLTAFQNQLFSEFREHWQAMWDAHPDGVTPEAMEVTKRDIGQKLLPLITAQRADLPAAICTLATITEYGHGYELGTLLRSLLESFDPTGTLHLQLLSNPKAPWFIRRDAAGYLANFVTPEVQKVLRGILLAPGETGEVRGRPSMHSSSNGTPKYCHS